MRRYASTGSKFETEIGYSRAVACNGLIFVAGTTGYDYTSMIMPERIEDQCRNALATIDAALRKLGAGLDDVVKVTYILPDAAAWPACWPITRAAFATARPAATMISAGLQAPEMKIEIEAIAIAPGHLDAAPTIGQ